MTKPPDATILARLDADDHFGSGPSPSDAAADDRSGRFWLVIDDKLRVAVKVALLTGRPLLLEGASGSGKSSLAKALANTLGWVYTQKVITSQTRLEELTGHVDVVRRLHQAQLAGHLGGEKFPRGLGPFIVPGVLWWAFDPTSARTCGTRFDDTDDSGEDAGNPMQQPSPGAADPEESAVVLLDEIDKAEPDLPNNLLVPLGSLELPVEGRPTPVEVTRTYRPLIVITSNQERDLPPAFLRRCIAIQLELPSPDELEKIAAGHVDTDRELIAEVRKRFVPGDKNKDMSPAEFVDAVRAAHGLGLKTTDDASWDQVRKILRGTRPALDRP